MAVLVLYSGTAWPGDFQDALAAADRGDFATALNLWRPLAQGGDALAQYNLGVLYRNGLGVRRDYNEAMRWYRSAAQQGLPIAQYDLGAMYRLGQGVAQDYVRAHMWLNLSAAAMGHPDAVKDRNSTAEKMTQEQITQAEQMARRCEDSEYKDCD
ncbi:MAG TPA: tetratricopeptide repeat protein [Burkholderiales bacterium]|nr:tetratricopeptide repeat protein [Burkholderiales bacterium]